ncbi:MAG: hypothetical protein ACRDY3_07325, partial [Acidimicrobiales bacterium]
MSRRRFDYAVPDRWRAEVRLGTRVRIPFHGRRVGGWVTALDVTPATKVQALAITGVSGHGPPPAVLDLAAWAAWRWAMPLATVLRLASPDRNVHVLPSPPPSASPEPRTCTAEEAVTGANLLRRPPAEDLLPIVLEALDHPTAGTVVVLVPSTGWAARLTERLRRRGVAVADGWAQAAAGWPVVVGSRSAAWAPVAHLGAAVVLDCHDYQDRYDPVEVLVERAARDGAPCTLVSPCPSAVQQVRYGPVRALGRAVEREGWPAVSVVDRRAADPRTGLLSEELVRLADRRPPRPEAPLVCVLNRTAPLLACAGCGELVRCEGCGRTVGESGGELACRWCGQVRPAVCASCGATRLAVRRRSVSRVRGELAALLGMETGEVWGPRQEVPEAPVLVGTEAVLHRVRRASSVAFLDFDQHLLAPRYVAAEDSLTLLARAGRLTGGRLAPGAAPGSAPGS